MAIVASHTGECGRGGCPYCLTSRTIERDAARREVARLRAALETAERDTEARIAAWLRRHPAIPYVGKVADRIERGDHRKDDDHGG